MSVALDGIIFSLQRHGGISVYFRELIKQLASESMPATLTVEGLAVQSIPQATDALNVLERSARPLERYRAARLPEVASIFHSSYYRVPERTSLTSVVSVHDFTYERFNKGPALWVHRYQKNKAIRGAQAIICISESTRDDLYELVGVRSDQTVHVIPNGVADVFRPIIGIERYSRDLLFVGERRGYKNFRLLLESLAFLPDYQVKCVGGGALRDEEFTGLIAGVRERVSHVGFIADERLNACYNAAACLVYPSAYEGFGIPVIEAMQAGCPVVAIECKAVKEVGGSALITAKEATPIGLAQAIAYLEVGENRQEAVENGLLRATQYSWQRTHAETLQVYRALGA